MGANEKFRKKKMANIKSEMKSHSFNILGLSGVKWKKSGDCYYEGYRFISDGGGKGEHAIAIILDQEMARTDSEDEEIEQMYEKIENLIKSEK